MSSFISTFLKGNSAIQNLDAKTFVTQLKEDQNAVLIDVRTQAEHYDARIPDSTLLDLMNPHFIDELEKLNKSKNYYLYCRSGNRSYHAGREMAKMGFEKVYNLSSGIIGWNGEIER